MPEPAPTTTDVAELFWEQHYRGQAQHWSGRPNPVLVDVAGQLRPGRALDLGCGEGGDALWLAGQGWQVTAVDIAPTAVERLRARAERDGLADRVRTERHNLAHSLPAGEFDLISAQYLHTPVELARAEVLRAVANQLAPGGLLLVVDHGSVAPWSWNQDADTHFPTPAEKFAELALDPAGWHAERLDSPKREATGPDGQTATVTDHVIAVRRSGQESGQEKRSGLNTSASTTSTL